MTCVTILSNKHKSLSSCAELFLCYADTALHDSVKIICYLTIAVLLTSPFAGRDVNKFFLGAACCFISANLKLVLQCVFTCDSLHCWFWCWFAVLFGQLLLLYIRWEFVFEIVGRPNMDWELVCVETMLKSIKYRLEFHVILQFKLQFVIFGDLIRPLRYWDGYNILVSAWNCCTFMQYLQLGGIFVKCWFL